MDQPQDTYPKAARDLISTLTKEITNLKDENAQLQVRRDRIRPNGCHAGCNSNFTESTGRRG